MPDHPTLGLDNVVRMPDNLPPIVGDVAEIVQRYGYAAVLSEVHMHAPLMSVPSAPARPTDPETSHLAVPYSPDVSRFSARSRQGKLLVAFRNDMLTDHEATVRVIGTHATPSQWDGCRRRCSDLRAAGFLTDAGYRRKNPGSNDESIVWKMTYAGQLAYTNMHNTGWSRDAPATSQER